MTKKWTPYKIRCLSNRLIEMLKAEGIRCTRVDVSQWGQAVLTVDGKFVAGLDFPSDGRIECTAGGLYSIHERDDLSGVVRRLVNNLASVQRQTQTDGKPVRLEVRNRSF